MIKSVSIIALLALIGCVFSETAVYFSEKFEGKSTFVNPKFSKLD